MVSDCQNFLPLYRTCTQRTPYITINTGHYKGSQFTNEIVLMHQTPIRSSPEPVLWVLLCIL